MTIRIDLFLRSPSLPLVTVVRSVQLDELEYVHRGRIEDGRQLFIVQIDETADVPQGALAEVDEVAEATALGRAGGKEIYKCIVDLDDSFQRMYDADLDGAPLEPPVVRPDGWYETKIFKNYSTLSEFQSVCRDNDIEVELHSITSGHAGSKDAPAYGLTERQHEALTLALSRGYYESPRRTSTETLAHELDISQPSMSALLRRAEHQILSSTLGSQTRVEIPSS